MSSTLNPSQNVRVILQIEDGSFTTGFSVTLLIFDETGPIQEDQNFCMLPSVPDIPDLFEQWQHVSLNNSFRLQAVEGQMTHAQAGQWEEITKQLSNRCMEWFRDDAFIRLSDRILANRSVTRDKSVPIMIKCRTADEQQNNIIRRLPWNLWHSLFDELTNAEFALFAGYQERVPPLQFPVKVLAVFGSQNGLDLNPDTEALRKLERGGRIVSIVEPQTETFSRLLDQENWDILFFAGHSSSEGSEGKIQLNQTQSLSLSTLRSHLKRTVNNGLHLAIFNSCDGLKIAEYLSTLKIPATVVMREPVPDAIAGKFLQNFLQEFSQGTPLCLSVRRAREQLESEQDRFPAASHLPVVCLSPNQPELVWPQPRLLARIPRFVSITMFVSLIVVAAIGSLRSTQEPDENPGPYIVSPNDTEIRQVGDGFSLGEEFLIQKPRSASANKGSIAFHQRKYEDAVHEFITALEQKANDPELLIYLNNAQAAASGKPMSRIAVSIPASDATDDAQELLRGLAQAQTEHNCGVDLLKTAINNPTLSLDCQADDIGIQVLIVDHEDRNNDARIVQRFEQIEDEPYVMGSIGRYNSSMTFILERAINQEKAVISVIAATSTAIRKPDQIASGYVFRTSPTDDATARKWRDYLERKNAQRIVILSDSGPNSDYSQSLRNEFNQLLSSTVKRQSYDCDLDAIDVCLRRIEGQTIDAIILAPSDDVGYINTALNFVDRYEEQYDDQPFILGGDTLYGNQAVLERIVQGSLLETLTVAVPWHRSQNVTDFERNAWVLWDSSINWRTAMGYDGAMLLMSAISQLGNCNYTSTCRQDVRDYILANGLENGATGDSTFYQNGNRKVDSSDRVPVLVKVKISSNTRIFECLDGEPCAH